MVEPARDIYEILGIDPSASTGLAREFYWRRTGAFVEAERSGDPSARTAIEELNEALAIVMDPTLRARYDAQRPTATRTPADSTAVGSITESLARRSYRRAFVVVGLVPAVAVLIGIAFVAGSALLGSVAMAVGIALFVIGARWATSGTVHGLSPFVLLRVREGASVEELDAAYENQVHEILLRIDHDPQALRRLELLDEAYLRASAFAAEGASGQEGRRLRQVDWVGWQARRAGAGLTHGLYWTALAVLRATSVATSVAARRLRELLMGAARRAERASQRQEVQVDEAQLERRLATAFRDVSVRVTSSPGPGVPATAAHTEVPETARVRGSLVLGSAGGERRIPVGSTPLRIGSGPTCDVVLRRPGVAVEHALIWQRGDSLVLHVTDQYAACLVNERPMSWATLDDGDVLRLGEATMRVELASDTP